jgi:hypothetical protein
MSECRVQMAAGTHRCALVFTFELARDFTTTPTITTVDNAIASALADIRSINHGSCVDSIIVRRLPLIMLRLPPRPSSSKPHDYLPAAIRGNDCGQT